MRRPKNRASESRVRKRFFSLQGLKDMEGSKAGNVCFMRFLWH